MPETIEKITIAPVNLRGRPASYSFEKLIPGHRLLIPIPKDIDVREHRKKVTHALIYYKKSNGFLWHSAVRIEGENIVVYRLS